MSGVLHAVAVGSSIVIPDSATGDEISVSVTVPENADKMDLYLYLWKDMNNLTPSIFEPECVIVGDTCNLFIMGDSMCANYTESIPQQGWGFYFRNEFDPHINAVNYAVGGYTTAKVLDDTAKNSWSSIKPGIEPGDYVIMSLGYNDRNGAAEVGDSAGTLTGDEYMNNLRKLYDECVELGATMIFVTPATDLWRWETGIGMVNRGAVAAQEMKIVAQEKNAICLDLNTALWNSYVDLCGDNGYYLAEAKNRYYLSTAYLAGLGIDPSTVTWNNSVKTVGQDLVHFNDDGALHLSNLIKGLFAENGLPIARFLK